MLLLPVWPATSENRRQRERSFGAALSTPEAGGDFADGIIAYEGNWLGGETFVSFDAEAVRLLNKQGQATHLLT